MKYFIVFALGMMAGAVLLLVISLAYIASIGDGSTDFDLSGEHKKDE